MKQVMIRFGLALAMLAMLLPALVSATTYVFPYEGFRYTVQNETERVLTQTNLSEHETFIKELGTDTEAVLANYAANGIVMEVIPEDGGQISVSVTDDPYMDEGKVFEELTDEEKQALLHRFEESGLYERCELTDGKPGAVRLVSSAMFASMPVYSVRYVTFSHDRIYTLNRTVVGRQVNEEDDQALRTVLAGMQMFAPRTKATPEPTPEPTPAPTPEPENRLAEAEKVKGNMVLDPVSAVTFEETLTVTGKTDAGADVHGKCNDEAAGRTVADSEGKFSLRIRLKTPGENHLLIETENASAELTVTSELMPARVTIVDPAETAFTGETVLVRGTTVPNALVYFNGEQINTNVTANRNGAFSIRLTFPKAGKYTISIRSHLKGYSDYHTTLVLERIMTERERLAEFKANAVPVDYNTLKTQYQNYADVSFVLRGKVMEYTDYNGKPCALVCVGNPSTGIWRDPVYVVLETEEVPETGTVMTFYLEGEGITLPAPGSYMESGNEEEVPVARALYITDKR